MSIHFFFFFFYKYGQGHTVDEYEVEPMDLVLDEELLAIEAIISGTQFTMNKPPKGLIA